MSIEDKALISLLMLSMKIQSSLNYRSRMDGPQCALAPSSGLSVLSNFEEMLSLGIPLWLGPTIQLSASKDAGYDGILENL